MKDVIRRECVAKCRLRNCPPCQANPNREAKINVNIRSNTLGGKTTRGRRVHVREEKKGLIFFFPLEKSRQVRFSQLPVSEFLTLQLPEKSLESC
ncbi:hypothetical protein AVEN_265459-1 [Araneus ventricosus]|uniref:Uncharacterized protein n=1 Tax=Araneus ventricosus TaxID=182803 RepID=A0A4Y2CHP9_ARAVE|nr:hypothetical protein AVEN_265459-1 [Araneus ventricosus]